MGGKMEMRCLGEGERLWLRGRNGWGWLEVKGEWEKEDDERRLGRTKTVGGGSFVRDRFSFRFRVFFCIFLMFQNCPPPSKKSV
jgi:hypothetical protein